MVVVAVIPVIIPTPVVVLDPKSVVVVTEVVRPAIDRVRIKVKEEVMAKPNAGIVEVRSLTHQTRAQPKEKSVILATRLVIFLGGADRRVSKMRHVSCVPCQ
jgi:hypothetical protein